MRLNVAEETVDHHEGEVSPLQLEDLFGIGPSPVWKDDGPGVATLTEVANVLALTVDLAVRTKNGNRIAGPAGNVRHTAIDFRNK